MRSFLPFALLIVLAAPALASHAYKGSAIEANAANSTSTAIIIQPKN